MTPTEHFYRQERARQMDFYPSCVTSYTSGRTELTAAGAPYGEHALAAFRFAKRTINFHHQFAAEMKTMRKRSAAAKRGWKTRRESPTTKEAKANDL